MQELDVPCGEVAVDLCCGDRYFTAALCRLGAPGKVYAVELDPEILNQAKQCIMGQGARNCIFVGSDARNLPGCVPSSVSYVLLANTFHGIPDKMEISQAVYEVLHLLGRFGLVNWHVMPRRQTRVLNEPRGPATEMRLSPEQTRAIIEPTGFELERIVELPPYHYGAIFTKTVQHSGTP